MESIWSRTEQTEARPPLDGDITVDAAVIGGGMAGILTAYFLKEAGLDVCVLEAERVGSGQTKNTTAKITSQHGLIYGMLIEKFGQEKAHQYAEANQRAIKRFGNIIRKHRISCEFEEKDAYLYSVLDAEPLRQEAEAAKHAGIDAGFVTETTLPFAVKGAVRFAGQAQFHPLKFLNAIAKELPVYERTKVQKIKENRVVTDRGTVTAKHIIMAAHYPFINAPGFYFTRMHQERSYVLALEQAANVDGMYLGVDAGGYSFRNSGEYLLLGGGNHRTGENSGGGKYAALREKAAEWYPDSREAAYWSAQDCMTLDGVPYIGQFAESTPSMYVVTGFGKWGMTTSMAAAEIIAELVMDNSHPYPVFSPQRFVLSASAKTMLEDGLQAVKGLGRSAFSLPRGAVEDLPRGHGGVVEYNGLKAGVYRTEEGELFVVDARCPHLGCQLEWNPDEKSWDCPCHGSRFDFKGNLIDNPAEKDLYKWSE